MYIGLIAVMLFNVVTGKRIFKSLLNPITIYNAIWTVICLLYQLKISGWQNDLENKTCIYMISISIFFSFSCLCTYILSNSFRKVYNNKLTKKDITNNKINEYVIKNVNLCFFSWIIVEIIEIIYSGGIPVLWILIGSSKTYFDFGIPTVHGFANALGLSIMMIYFYEFLQSKNRAFILKILFMLFFYCAIITRQVVVSALMQMFIIYCFYIKKIPYKVLFILAVLGTIGFGIIGNIRTGYNNFLYVSLIDSDISPFFIGIYWVYMYLTMTMANVNNLFNLTFEMLGFEHISKLYLPSIISESLFSETSYNHVDFLITQAFNVSGYFADFYLAFGFKGVIFLSSLYGLFSGIIYNKIKYNNTPKNIIYYSIILQIILLSFFDNMLLYLPVCFQFVIIYFLFKKYKITKKEQ